MALTKIMNYKNKTILVNTDYIVSIDSYIITSTNKDSNIHTNREYMVIHLLDNREIITSYQNMDDLTYVLNI